MEEQTVSNSIKVTAEKSGFEATSGKIIASYNGEIKEISAVVFSETEVEKLFVGTDLRDAEVPA